MSRPNTPRRIITGLAVGALLLLHGWIAIASSARKSATFDEIAHVGGGALQWLADDYRFNAESGVLVQRWAAWPLASTETRLPEPDHPARQNANVWLLGREILYGEGQDANARLGSSRAMVVTLSLALGLTVFCWSRALFGTGGGLLSLLLYALSPTIIAHARLVTADLAVALFFLLATGAIWLLLERPCSKRFGAAVLATAGLLMVKMSGLLIVPLTGILWLLHWARRRNRTPGEDAPSVSQLAPGRLLIWSFAFAAAVFACLWAGYGFRYSADPHAPPEGSTFLHPWESLTAEEAGDTLLWNALRQARLLPEAYLWGLAYTLETTRERDAFLRGESSQSGWWWFFPYAVLIKTPLALFGLLGLAVFGLWGPKTARARAHLSLAAPLGALFGLYWLVAISSDLNIGHRHMLPIYPVLFISAGGAARWITRRSPLPAAFTVLCLSAFGWESANIYPHYLSYFNQLAGGPINGYKHLVDSSLDWGQDLPELATLIEELQAEDSPPPVYAAYFGAAQPDYYGIQPIWLASYFPQAHPARVPAPLTAGVYCVSVTLLQLMHLQLSGTWTAEHERSFHEQHDAMQRFIRLSRDAAGQQQLLKERPRESWMQLFADYERLRSGRLFRFLSTREPDARIGFSIHVYRLSAKEIAQAMSGPLPLAPETKS